MAQIIPMDNASVTVSVVMPCFNAAPFIAEALNSVLSQGVRGIEVIVVDDGSTDDSVAVALSMGPAVKVIRQVNAGPAAARNRGVREAQGRFVAFLDADDLWLPGKLAEQLKVFETRPEAAVVYGPFLFWRPDEDGAPQRAVAYSPTAQQAMRSGWLYPEILLDSLVCIITAIVRREVFDAIGAFDEQLRTGEDYDFWIRAARFGACISVERPLACYRLHGGGTTRVPRPQCNEYEVVRAAARTFGLQGQDGVSLAPHRLRQRLYRLSFDHGYLHYWHGQARVAQRQFARALGHAPWHGRAWIYWALAGAKRLLGH